MMPGSLQAEKQQLRREMLEKRRSLTTAEIATWSGRIADHFCSWPVYRNSGTVMFYLAMPDEPQTEPLIQDALQRGKRICVPLLGEKYGEMTAAAITSLDDLVIGKLGLKMPNPGKTEHIPPTAIDLVVVPAVAFDRGGNRLGMGAGYYDRFLMGKRCLLLGVTWTCQLIDKLPCEEHDIRMRYLLTEDGFFSCSQSIPPSSLGGTANMSKN